MNLRESLKPQQPCTHGMYSLANLLCKCRPLKQKWGFAFNCLCGALGQPPVSWALWECSNLAIVVLSTSVALPLSARRIVRSVFFRRSPSALLSVPVKLPFGLEESLSILTVSCLASSAISTGSDLTAFYTPVRISCMGKIARATS